MGNQENNDQKTEVKGQVECVENVIVVVHSEILQNLNLLLANQTVSHYCKTFSSSFYLAFIYGAVYITSVCIIH